MNINKMIWSTIQRRLMSLGYYSLKADGVPGSGTENAVIRFKEVNGLRARFYIGPMTMSYMFSDLAKPQPNTSSAPGALAEALNWLGTKEYRGKANNPAIMRWAEDLDQWYTGDDVPWCGLFIAHCNAKAYPNEPQDFNRLGARNWLQWGEDAGAPLLGSTCVLWRTHKTKSWNGHVFTVDGVSPDGRFVRGVGGNQSDSVSRNWFDASRVLGYRTAEGVKLPKAPTYAKGAMAVSVNEA